MNEHYEGRRQLCGLSGNEVWDVAAGVALRTIRILLTMVHYGFSLD